MSDYEIEIEDESEDDFYILFNLDEEDEHKTLVAITKNLKLINKISQILAKTSYLIDENPDQIPMISNSDRAELLRLITDADRSMYYNEPLRAV